MDRQRGDGRVWACLGAVCTTALGHAVICRRRRLDSNQISIIANGTFAGLTALTRLYGAGLWTLVVFVACCFCVVVRRCISLNCCCMFSCPFFLSRACNGELGAFRHFLPHKERSSRKDRGDAQQQCWIFTTRLCAVFAFAVGSPCRLGWCASGMASAWSASENA